MTPETIILTATGVVAVRIVAAPIRRHDHHLVRRTVRLVRRPRRSLSVGYITYINSPAWRRVRYLVLERAGYRCEHRGPFGRCRETRGLQAHHDHYRHFGHEWDGVHTHGESLRALCSHHHHRADRRRRRMGG